MSALTLKRVTDRTLRWSRFSVRDEDGREVALIGEFLDWDPDTFAFGNAHYLVMLGRVRDWTTRHATPQSALRAVQAALEVAS